MNKLIIVIVCILMTSLTLVGCGSKVVNCEINANGTCITKISSSSIRNYQEAETFCGGVKNLPTPKDLVNIASFVYESKPQLKDNQDLSGLKRNKDNFKLFDKDNFGMFDIYSSKSENSKSVYIRSYYKKKTTWDITAKDNDAGILAVCISH